MKNDVVISGIGGKFPNSYDFEEFKCKLLNGENLLQSDPDRCLNKAEQPPSSGRIPNWRHFDPTFFGLHPRLAENCDPAKGLILERSFEAILDSGMNPFDMKGRNVAVMVTMDTSEANTVRGSSPNMDGFGMIGHAKTMMANRVSYFLNFTGPSVECDNAGTGGLLVLEKAARMVREGEVEAAVVAAVNTFILDSVDTEYKDLNLLSPDRICYPFDERAQGLVRCEGVVAFFIQRAQDARKSYCSVLKAQTQYLGNKIDSIVSLNSSYEEFLNKFYREANIDPIELAYIEANSCCIHEYDSIELNIISDMTKNRSSPLLIGSLAGNLGYAECVSGFMSIVKAITALETGIIPRTLNYSQPNSKVPGLVNGDLKPVTSNTKLEGDLIAVTNLSLFGSVGHVLLKRTTEEKPERKALHNGLPSDGLHRVIMFQARHEAGALEVLKKIAKKPFDPEAIMLANDCFKTEIPAYMFRGFAVLPTEGSTQIQSIQAFDPTKRPVWYIFSGMGSQWAGMGRDLLQFPVFAAAIDKCDKVLRPRGLEIRHIITSDDPSLFGNILNCFVGIAAVQLGLVDIMTTVGISPDGMIGHSVGELGCAYADGCFTAEQMILAAYARGKASLESELIPGMMAAVGRGYQDMKDQVPDTVDVACHNSATSCTLSGPTDDINNYVDKLKSQGVFAKAVSAGGIAYHSRYIKDIGLKLLKYLKEAIPDPRPRSSNWISSSVPEAKWDTDEAKLCSAEYHTNNLLSPVLFEEACKHLPKNAILVEIAPRGLLQAILKRAIGPDNISVSLTSNIVQSNVVSVLNSLGKLYLNNVDVNVNALYPAVSYPVSRNTPGLASLVTWQHDTDYYQAFVDRFETLYLISKNSMEDVMEINSFAPEYLEWNKFLVKGQVLIQLPSLLMHVKKTTNNKLNTVGNCFTAFEDVTIKHYLPVRATNQTLHVVVSGATGNFEITKTDEGNTETPEYCMNGAFHQVNYNIETTSLELDRSNEEDLNIYELSQVELYGQLAAFGFQVEESCQLIEQIVLDHKGCTATVRWSGDVIGFLNAIFNVVMVFHMDVQQTLLLPSHFIKLMVDFDSLENMKTSETMRVHYDYRCNRLVVCDVLELLGLTLSPVQNLETTTLTWNQMKLQPYFENKISLSNFIAASIQLVAERNISTWKEMPDPVESIIIQSQYGGKVLSDAIAKSFSEISNIQVITRILEANDGRTLVKSGLGKQNHLIVGSGKEIVDLIYSMNMDKSVYFLVYFTSNHLSEKIGNLQTILTTTCDGVCFALLKTVELDNAKTAVEACGIDWLKDLRKVIREDTSTAPVILYTHNLSPRDILPVLAKESYASRVRTVFVMDKSAPHFQVDSSFYNSQLRLGLPVNILSGKVWNSLRTFPVDIQPSSSTIDNLIKLMNCTIDIQCVGLNPRSISLCDDLIMIENSEEIQYLDYSGLENGKNVMGVAIRDPKINSVTLDPVLKWEVPDSWSLKDAATVPATYTLAYFLLLQGKFKSSYSVLIHLGTSLLGQALVNLCLKLGATVYVSVKDDNEAIDLQKQFPELEATNIVILERQELKTKLKTRTRGEGVDLIFNGHRGAYLQDAISLTGSHGIFFHLCEIKAEDNEHMGLAALFNNTMYKSLNLKSVMETSENEKTRLQFIIRNGIQSNIIEPFKHNLFKPTEEIEAVRNIYTDHMSHKSVIAVNTTPIMRLNSCIVQKQSIIVTGKTDFWMDLAEWIVDRGFQKLVILNSGEEISNQNIKRLNRLIDHKQIILSFTSTVNLDSIENAKTSLTTLSQLALVSSLFCVEMDEDSEEMQNLDWASREVLPDLDQFVCLLGAGSGVSESRRASGLPVISIQNRTPLQSPRHILPYLSTILQNGLYLNASFYLVEDDIISPVLKDTVDFTPFLPSSEDDLLLLNSQFSNTVRFQEVVTLSPGYAHVSHCLLPVFIIPGLGSHRLEPLFRRLINPAFSCSLPVTVSSIQSFAEELMNSLTEIQPKGPYNIVGESWSGPVALALSHMMEAKGHQVNLILIEATPHMVQRRIKALSEEFNRDMAKALGSHVFQFCKEVKYKSSTQNTVNSLATLLTSLAQHVPTSQRLQGLLTLVTRNSLGPDDFQRLTELSEKTPQCLSIEDVSHHQLISNPATAVFINDHMAYSWN